MFNESNNTSSDLRKRVLQQKPEAIEGPSSSHALLQKPSRRIVDEKSLRKTEAIESSLAKVSEYDLYF